MVYIFIEYNCHIVSWQHEAHKYLQRIRMQTSYDFTGGF